MKRYFQQGFQGSTRNSYSNDMDNSDGGGNMKRKMDGDFNSPQKKKGSFNDPDTVYLKFLVPQATAGSVIGKKGSNISDLQKEYNVHIRMSKANDTFPGSDARVAVMSGSSLIDVLNATMVIFKRMTSPSDLFPKNPRPKSVSEKEICLIVPQPTAGLIIGKGGSRVKSIQEESNCHINLTQKNEQLPTNERVVTIQNNETNPDNIEKALKAILEIIKGDPQSSSCLTINYSSNRDDYNDDYHESGGGGDRRDRNSGWRGNDSGGGGGGGGGRNDRGGGPGPQGPPMGGGPQNNNNNFPQTSSGYPPQVHFWCTFAGPPISNGHTPPPQMLEGMKSYLLNVGFPAKAIQDIVAACNLLASYGVLKPGNISIFNQPQYQQQQVNPFNTMMNMNTMNSGNASMPSMTMPMGGMGMSGGGGGANNSMEGWNNPMMFNSMKQQQQQMDPNTGPRGGGFEQNNFMGGGGGGGSMAMGGNMGGNMNMGGGGGGGGMGMNNMNNMGGGGGGQGFNDMNNDAKRRF